MGASLEAAHSGPALRFRKTTLPIIDESCSPASSDVRITTRAANGCVLAPRFEHRISRNDQTVVLFGIDGGQPTRSPLSVGFVIPEVRTRARVGECGPPSRWNQSPTATPQRRSRRRAKPREGLSRTQTPRAPFRQQPRRSLPFSASLGSSREIDSGARGDPTSEQNSLFSGSLVKSGLKAMMISRHSRPARVPPVSSG
jgi:hypothetical protein